MAIKHESVKNLFGPGSYPLINLLNQLNSDDNTLRNLGKCLFDYSQKNYPNSLVEKFLETIQRSSSSPVTGILCYDILRDILPSIWPKLSSATRDSLKISLYYKVSLENDYGTLKACCSCVSSLAGLLFPKFEWDVMFRFMFENLSLNSLSRNLAALLLWDELIPKCPEVFVSYVDFLIEGFRELMPTMSEDHRCGVVAARASVKLILYLSTPASYCKFYVLLGHVIMTLFMACRDEGVLVCSVLEELIVLAGVEPAFFEVHIGVVFESMVKLAENLELGEKLRQLAVEFVVTLAENREIGCGMMKMVPKEEVTKLLGVLIMMLVYIEDGPSWGNAISDDGNEGESSMCRYGKENLDRLAMALGGNVIVPSCPVCLFKFLHDEDWKIRHGAVTAIGVISEGCSKALLLEMEKLAQTIVNLTHDSHPRVRWATVHTIGQLSTYLSPRFQEEYLWQFLPALIEVLDDFDNPRLQTRAASAIRLFSRKCRADDLNPHLHKIVSKLLGFLQRGKAMMKEAALETLASLAISAQEDSAYIYDSIMPYLKVILQTATDDTSRTLRAKSMECITMVTMAIGNQAIHGYVEKVTAVLISLQETQTEIEDPMRRLSLLAYGRLCKCLGADFLPYLSLAMPIVLKSALLKNYLSVSNDSDDSDDESMIKVTAGNKKIGIRSALLEEKALACRMLCCFAAELKEGMHLWVNEVVSALVPSLTFEFSEEVRMAAISAMPLLLNSASCAMKKGLPVTGCGKSPVQKLSDTIIPPLLDALKKESKVQVQARLMEAFNESIQIPSSRLSKHQAEKFVEAISKVLSTCSYCKTERKKKAKEHADSREQELLQKEAEQHLTICRNIGICLGTMVRRFKASFLPLFDKFLPYVSLMWSNDRTAEERRIVVHLFRDVAEQCGEEAFRYYEEWIPLLLKIYYHKNPDVLQIVATAIGICAEFGADYLKPHKKGIIDCLRTALEHPNAKNPDNIMAYEAAVSTCGKLNQFLSEDIYTYEFIRLWLSHLPIKCNLDEAKISHELLCSMLEMSERKVIGSDGFYLPNVIAIFAEILWAGNNLATEETSRRIINLLKKFHRELKPSVLSTIFETLPLPQQNMLGTILSTL